MITLELVLFCLALGLVSLLYGSVGQAGGSGFIAVMALSGFAAHSIKPTALLLNVLVSAVVASRFWVAGHLSWRELWPFVLASMPAAFVGGYLTLPATLFNLLLGALLIVSSGPMLMKNTATTKPLSQHPGLVPKLLVGSVIGLISGLTGMGGGILLIPVLVYFRWHDIRSAAALSAVFIFLNSTLALAGHWSSGSTLPPAWPLYAIVAMAGGAIGAQLGSRHWSTTVTQKILGVVLLTAGLHLLILGMT